MFIRLIDRTVEILSSHVWLYVGFVVVLATDTQRWLKYTLVLNYTSEISSRAKKRELIYTAML